jgi:phenylacetate-CoA ligase
MFPQFGYVELIGKDGQHIQNEDEVGEVVGTSLVNHVFPFIRYKLGDLGVYTNQQCPCGCHYPLLKKIEGRTQEIALSKTHQPFSLTGLYDFVAKSTQHIKECQFYQDTAGTLILNIVKTHEFTDKDHHTIQKNFQNLFGDRMDLTIQFVDHISLTPSGKYRFFIQKIPIESIQY